MAAEAAESRLPHRPPLPALNRFRQCSMAALSGRYKLTDWFGRHGRGAEQHNASAGSNPVSSSAAAAAANCSAGKVGDKKSTWSDDWTLAPLRGSRSGFSGPAPAPFWPRISGMSIYLSGELSSASMAVEATLAL